MSGAERQEIVEKIMQDNNIWGEIEASSEKSISIRIEDGDWKHSHLRLKWAISDVLNPINHSEAQIGESDDDCYSAIHTFIFA